MKNDQLLRKAQHELEKLYDELVVSKIINRREPLRSISFEVPHELITLKTKLILKKVPVNQSTLRIRVFLLKGRRAIGTLSFTRKKNVLKYSHTTLGTSVDTFYKALIKSAAMLAIHPEDIQVLKAFYSGEYFLRIKGNEGFRYFQLGQTKTDQLIELSAAQFINLHNQAVEQLILAEKSYRTLKKERLKKDRAHLKALHYL